MNFSTEIIWVQTEFKSQQINRIDLTNNTCNYSGMNLFGLRTTGHQNNWAPGQLGTRTTGHPDHWALDNWAPGQLGTRTTGDQDNWA